MLFNKKLTITVCLLSAVVFMATTAMQIKKDDDEMPKNLKVLPKNISHDELEKVMHDWDTALGVRCNFCHARNTETNKMDFASDAKPEKNMAREMMKMTAKINKKYFKMDDDKGKGDHKDDMMAAISCMTCHHGSAHPNAASMGGKQGPEHNTPPPPPPAQQQ